MNVTMKHDLYKNILRVLITISFGVMKLVFACSSSSEDTNKNDNLSNRSSVFIFEDDTEWGDGYFESESKLDCETPIYQRPRRFPPPVAEEIERQCRELHSLDIIEPSASPWNSPIVPVRKKDGSIRLCIDYRKLNKVTIADKFPVPNLYDSLYGLGSAKYFTRLDLVRGYYQLPVDEQSRAFTAFSSAKNHWQFKRLSFGL